jgi:hypothetical protein
MTCLGYCAYQTGFPILSVRIFPGTGIQQLQIMKYLQVLAAGLIAMVLSFILLFQSACKKDAGPDPADPSNWSYGPVSSYSVSPGSPVTDSVTGFQFYMDESGSASFSVYRITEGANPGIEGSGYKIEYSGNAPLYIKATCQTGYGLLSMRYGYPEGIFEGERKLGWIGMAPWTVNHDSTEFMYSLPEAFTWEKSTASPNAPMLMWFREFKKASDEGAQYSAIGLQIDVFLGHYTDACNPALKAKVEAARKAKSYSMTFGTINSYDPFWLPLGYFSPIYHPTINFDNRNNQLSAEDVAHETAHYFVNLLVGNAVQLSLTKQGSILNRHGINELMGRNYVVDELAYFVETIVDYQVGALSEPVFTFAGRSPLALDFVSLEGFGGTMLYSLVRTTPTIQNIYNKNEKLDFPVIGLSPGQVLEIIAMGGLTNEEIRANIRNYLLANGTPTQKSRFPVALQRIGWCYSVEGTLKDSLTEKALEGYTIENIIQGNDGTTYSNGEPAAAHVTGSDGKFRFFSGIFPGESILRFSKEGSSFDVTIFCPFENPTNTTINLKEVKILASSGGIAIGQFYKGGIVFYIDSTGKHGLIAAPADLSVSADWGCYNKAVGCYDYAIGTGKANTQMIIDSCSQDGIAARLCVNSSTNGYSDWYLPSSFELYEIYRQKTLVGGIAGALYWSSTDWGWYSATGIQMGIGNTRHDITKEGSQGVHVRAIRSF